MKIEIDARGLNCPMPVINTKKELDKIEKRISQSRRAAEGYPLFSSKEILIQIPNSLFCFS